jgi:hypothetical protein
MYLFDGDVVAWVVIILDGDELSITRPVGSVPLARSRSVRSSLEMVSEGVAPIVSRRSCHRPGSAGRSN